MRPPAGVPGCFYRYLPLPVWLEDRVSWEQLMSTEKFNHDEEDVKYLMLNIGELRSNNRIKADGDWKTLRRCHEFQIIPMTEKDVKEYYESFQVGELRMDHVIFKAKTFRKWMYGHREKPPKRMNEKLSAKYRP
jgi:hypothetical protein